MALYSLIRNFAAMFEKNIEEYEDIRQEYQQKIADKMGEKQWMEYNEIILVALRETRLPSMIHVFFVNREWR